MANKGNDKRRQKRQADKARRKQRRETTQGQDVPQSRPPAPHPGGPVDPGEPGELLSELSSALADPDPVAFLAIASAMAHAVDPRERSPLASGPGGNQPRGTEPGETDPGNIDPADIDPGEFVDMLIDTPGPETTALLYALSALLPDELLGAKARREARRRPVNLPGWLPRLGEATVADTSMLIDRLGDGENLTVSVRLVTGEEMTAVMYVDHNMGTAAKDGFVRSGGLQRLQEIAANFAPDDPRAGELVHLPAAEARARITDAIEMGAMMFPPLESDSWPAARPLVEWIVRLLPEGGAAYERREWTEEEKHALAEEFLASPEAADLTDPDDGAIAENLLWFTTDYSGGDPFRWSPISVKILMGEWFTRKVLADRRYLLRMPTVLEAFVRYSGRIRELPRELVETNVAAVAEIIPEYTELVRGGGGRPWWLDGVPSEDLESILEEGDVEALRGALGLAGGPDLTGGAGLAEGAGYAAWGRQWAARMVGGEEALERLTADPLPPEGFAWDEVAEDIRPRVAEILALCDACAEEMFDPEYRTAFRRVLARTAEAEPAVFRRRSKNETAAAAIAWVVAAANERLNPIGDLTAGALLAHFGVSGSVADRARPFLRAFGAPEHQQAIGLTLATPEVLTSETRRSLIAERDSA